MLGEELDTFSKNHAQFIGKKLYKIRVAGKGLGKSGGYRAVVLVMEINHILAPVCIYAKSERESISQEELDNHLAEVERELSETP